MNEYIKTVKGNMWGTTDFEIELSPRVNFITGRNGAGKTALLRMMSEAICGIDNGILLTFIDNNDDNNDREQYSLNTYINFVERIITTKYDILPRRLIHLFSELFNAARDGQKIACIDDIDSYCLHPEMQWKLLPALMECLPKMQFIIATNSPILLSSCESKIFDLDRSNNMIHTIKGVHFFRVESVLKFIQHTTNIPPDLAKLVDSFTDAIDDEDYDKAKEIRDQIESLAGPNCSELWDCDTDLLFCEDDREEK